MDTEKYIAIVFLCALVLGCGYFIINSLIQQRNHNKKLLAEMEKPLPEPQLTEIEARVLEKQCCVATYGIRLPQSRREFYVTFLTTDGEEKRYKVGEEFYLSVDEGTSGTLAIVNDNFYDFYVN